jgi:hypothetical protein
MPPSFELINVLDEAIRNSLLSFRNSWFQCLIFATIAVVVGVGLEGPEILHELVNTERQKARWMMIAGLLGWLLIVGGVAGECVFEVLASKADGLIQTFDNIQLRATEKHAEEATREAGSSRLSAEAAGTAASQARTMTLETRREADSFERDIKLAKDQAAKAERDLAAAQNQAARANERALAAQTALDEYRAFRALTPEQQQRLASKLPHSDTQEATVAADPFTVESGRLAEQIVGGLQLAWPHARLAEVDPVGLTHAGAVVGIVVFSTKEKSSILAATALVSALQAEHLVASKAPNFLFLDCEALRKINPGIKADDPSCSMVVVTVGPKP